MIGVPFGNGAGLRLPARGKMCEQKQIKHQRGANLELSTRLYQTREERGQNKPEPRTLIDETLPPSTCSPVFLLLCFFINPGLLGRRRTLVMGACRNFAEMLKGNYGE